MSETKTDKVLRAAAIQLPSLPIEKAKLDYYLSIAKSKQVSLVMLGEYVTNLFFKELEKAPYGLIEDQAQRQKDNLTNLSRIYNVTIVAPLIWCEQKRISKLIAVFDKGVFKGYGQHALMPYKHWNERDFFSSEIQTKTPGFLTIDGFKIGLIGGFEIHFDSVWKKITDKRCDLVLLPTASTFESFSRWRELAKMRAFLGNTYILRANRVGEYHEKDGSKWQFYGDSFLVNPYGEIESSLGSSEEILIATISKNDILAARKLWGFHALSAKLDV